MIPSLYAKLSFAAIEEVFGRMGILKDFTKGELRFLSAHVKWQVRAHSILLE